VRAAISGLATTLENEADLAAALKDVSVVALRLRVARASGIPSFRPTGTGEIKRGTVRTTFSTRRRQRNQEAVV